MLFGNLTRALYTEHSLLLFYVWPPHHQVFELVYWPSYEYVSRHYAVRLVLLSFIAYRSLCSFIN